MIAFLNYSRNNSVILYEGDKIILLFSIFCEEKVLDPLVNFFSRKYTNRCALTRATVTLIVHSRITLKFDDRNCILIFFKFESFVLENGFQKILEIGHFVEKKILYHLRCFAPQIRQTIKEKIAKYNQN